MRVPLGLTVPTRYESVAGKKVVTQTGGREPRVRPTCPVVHLLREGRESMTRWWRLRAFPDDFEVEVGGFVADPIQRRESLEGLQRLLRDRDDSEVRRVLSEAFGALGR